MVTDRYVLYSTLTPLRCFLAGEQSAFVTIHERVTLHKCGHRFYCKNVWLIIPSVLLVFYQWSSPVVVSATTSETSWSSAPISIDVPFVSHRGVDEDSTMSVEYQLLFHNRDRTDYSGKTLSELEHNASHPIKSDSKYYTSSELPCNTTFKTLVQCNTATCFFHPNWLLKEEIST